MYVFVEYRFDMKKAIFSLLCAALLSMNAAFAARITIDHSAMTDFFVAAVGQTQSQTFDITTSGLTDWNGRVIVSSQSEAGTFVLSSTGLLKDGTISKTLTFQPKSAGTFTATITASGTDAASVSFTVSGTCGGGSSTEEKQGDELELDLSNPLAQYETSFDGVARNSALSLDGWTNVATVGTRAWWGYEFEGDNCAKVTCYDSQREEGAPCQMLLVSPALDFYNASYRQLGFRLRGDYLAADMPDSLTVVYMDMADDSLYVQPLMVAARTSDESGEWFPYVLHLEDQELAEVFWIGFLFEGTRGAGHAATYYIDDFSWGKWLEDVPTAVPVVDGTQRVVKRIVNGQLLIIRDGIRYNIVGQKR